MFFIMVVFILKVNAPILDTFYVLAYPNNSSLAAILELGK